MQLNNIKDQAIGRWRNLLPLLGVHERFLSGKHGPCPLCGGKDRFRWDDKAGTGSFYCNSCGAGSGVDLVMKANGVDFAHAKRLIADLLPSVPVIVPSATASAPNMSSRVLNMWRQALPLNGLDPASLYLISRGIRFKTWPTQLRVALRVPYTHDDKSRTYHPAMVANFVSPDATSQTVHTTYLDDQGRKAAVPTVRKLAPCKVPDGGAVRLSQSAETMGIAEGIETALSASIMFDVPVWAALSTNGMLKWRPPATAKHIIVFGDSDEGFAGQYTASALAYRLKREGYGVDLRLPDEKGTDWNDILQSEIRTSDLNGASAP